MSIEKELGKDYQRACDIHNTIDRFNPKPVGHPNYIAKEDPNSSRYRESAWMDRQRKESDYLAQLRTAEPFDWKW